MTGFGVAKVTKVAWFKGIFADSQIFNAPFFLGEIHVEFDTEMLSVRDK